MSRKILVDHHHSSLLHSLIYLFEDRLDIEVYRPIGLKWYTTGHWNIFPALDTAKQYLDLDQAYRPVDGTRPLNQFTGRPAEDGVYLIKDEDATGGFHKACTFEYFMDNDFDFVLASIPQHIAPFQQLARRKNAKFIVQAGNEWTIQGWNGYNVLASLAPRSLPFDVNAVFYHQEFPLDKFQHAPVDNYKTRPVINSFINVYEHNSGWGDFTTLERMTPQLIDWYSFGGQCRNGSIDGYTELGAVMRNTDIVFHVKAGGDGYGHVLHNAYACGRPVITRRSHYRGQWGEYLLTDDTCIDLDKWRRPEYVVPAIVDLAYDNDRRREMGAAARRRFEEVVDFEREASEIERWIERL